MMRLTVGDPFPALRLPGVTNANYVVDSAAGRYIVLAVLSTCEDDQVRTAIDLIRLHRDHFDDDAFCCFGLLPHREPWRGSMQDELPGLRWLFDDQGVSEAVEAGPTNRWILIDPTMRVMAVVGDDDAPRLLAALPSLPKPAQHGGFASRAPVLMLPRIFEPGLCEALIAHYDAVGGQPSGFMREIDGVTRLVNDTSHKRRSDVLVQDDTLVQAARARISQRLAPQIQKVFQFQATRIERYLVSRYDAETGGYFRPHRDNTTKGTAHRRFAVSLNLNSAFDGGDLRFPEFGSETHRPPPGGAVVFSCSLLHEATPVTRGQRYAFLPFLYDEAGAEIRARNLRYLEPGTG